MKDHYIIASALILFSICVFGAIVMWFLNLDWGKKEKPYSPISKEHRDFFNV